MGGRRANESRTKAARAPTTPYREAMHLSPEQFIQLETIKMQVRGLRSERQGQLHLHSEWRHARLQSLQVTRKIVMSSAVTVRGWGDTAGAYDPVVDDCGTALPCTPDRRRSRIPAAGLDRSTRARIPTLAQMTGWGAPPASDS